MIALKYFQNRRKDLPTILYILITVVDILSCGTCIPSAVAYINNREPMWYGESWFCYGWGMLWAVIPFMSVFLVAVLSITRTISLIRPLQQVKTQSVMIIVIAYSSYLIMWSTVPIIFGYGNFVYTPEDTYCWESTQAGWYSNVEIINGAVLLAFPIVPVIISCVISTYCVLSSLKISTLSTTVRNMKVEATITIILITMTYIFLNIPIFVIWVLYIYDNFNVRDVVILKYYSWSVCYVICVAFNATLNPVIYLSRMEKFRISFMGLFKKDSRLQMNRFAMKRGSFKSSGYNKSRSSKSRSFNYNENINNCRVIEEIPQTGKRTMDSFV